MLLKIICRNANTVCDVGSNGVDMLTFLPCKKKVSIDLDRPYYGDGVQSVKGDFLEFDGNDFDVITCFQVLEHIDDSNIKKFSNKLLKSAKVAVISVPYEWPKGQCKSHLQDPVSLEKVINWFGVRPIFQHIVIEKNGIKRIILIFGKKENSILSEVDFDCLEEGINSELSRMAEQGRVNVHRFD